MKIQMKKKKRIAIILVILLLVFMIVVLFLWHRMQERNRYLPKIRSSSMAARKMPNRSSSLTAVER